MSAFQPEVIQGTADAVIRFIRMWTDHSQEKGMTYMEHMGVALSMAGRMAYGSFSLTIHSIFPFWFQTTGSECIKGLYNEMKGQH